MTGRNRESAVDDRRWHFDRRISLDTLVGIVGIAVVIGGPMFYWASGMEKRVQKLEVLQMEGDKNDATRVADERQWRSEVSGKVDKIENKVTDLQITIGRLVPVATVTAQPRK